MRLTIFHLRYCPYCHKAFDLIRELQAQGRFPDVEIELVDEAAQPQRADSFDYQLVPAFFLGDRKLHEGVTTEGDLLRIAKLLV